MSTDGIISIPEVQVRRGGASFSFNFDGLIAAGGWCAPSDQVYDFLGGPSEPRISYCPEWIALDEDETDCYYHDCVDEYRNHTICKCEDCGAERIVLKEGS